MIKITNYRKLKIDLFQVKFIYQNEDAISELTFLIVQKAAGAKTSQDNVEFLCSFLLYDLAANLCPKTLVVTNIFCALCIEDHVHYPIPDFARDVPSCYRFESFSVHRIETIKCVAVCDKNMTVVFADESYFVVDINKDYFRYWKLLLFYVYSIQKFTFQIVQLCRSLHYVQPVNKLERSVLNMHHDIKKKAEQRVNARKI